jgi:hypothetical protein
MVAIFRAEVVGKSAPGEIERDRVVANPVWKGYRLDVWL